MKLLSVNPELPLKTPYWRLITSIAIIGPRKSSSSSAVGAAMNASGRSSERPRRGLWRTGSEAASISAPPR